MHMATLFYKNPYEIGGKYHKKTINPKRLEMQGDEGWNFRFTAWCGCYYLLCYDSTLKSYNLYFQEKGPDDWWDATEDKDFYVEN